MICTEGGRAAPCPFKSVGVVFDTNKHRVISLLQQTKCCRSSASKAFVFVLSVAKWQLYPVFLDAFVCREFLWLYFRGRMGRVPHRSQER